ncbi:GL18424 [Drosophila persimilis]|uniref:GL18424 n=1 Tax=Drosophila persimilis TaxID=7234 RepID=B4HA53_DROPE|nr:GL18424 [Drosophila persimilis]
MEDDLSDDGQPPPSLPPPQLQKAAGKSEPGAGGATANTLNLGMAQIIVTAATPMVEDGADKSFPPVGESEREQQQHVKKQDESKQEQPVADKKPEISPKPLVKVSPSPQKQPPSNAAQSSMTAAKEGNTRVRPVVSITLTEYPSCDPEDQQSFSEGTDSASGNNVPILQEVEDPFNEKSKTDSAGDGIGFEANFEANFDANFDDAFAGTTGGGGGGGGGGGEQSSDLDVNGEPAGTGAGAAGAAAEEDIEAPKQVVGGRASIPEELDSNQLARLQNLKESNA